LALVDATSEEESMPTLTLRNRTQVTLTAVQNTPYYRLGPHAHAYIHSDGLTIVGNNVTIGNEEYDGQVAAFLGVGLQLSRGVVRHHPLFYEVARMGILMPLGVGEMPDWATNETRFIPFGPNVGYAQGIALGMAGMGPGDDLTMIADYATVQGAVGNVQLGRTVTVTVTPGTGIAFYNAGEIQVRGPLFTGLTIAAVELPANALPPVPAGAEIAAYVVKHSRLRHARTVAAIGVAGNDNRLTAIRGDDAARPAHATELTTMRTNIRAMTGGMIDQIVALTKQTNRPGSLGNTDFRAYLDSSANREAHDAYIAEIVGGTPSAGARGAGQAAAVQWVNRVLTAYTAHYAAQVPLFPVGWDA
jgi:hypothetical protein